MIFDRHANLKYKYGNRKFWCRGKNKNDLIPEFNNSGGRGKEKRVSEGKNIESLVQALGIGIKVTPPFRADWKGCVEQNFRVLNTNTKPFFVGTVDGNFKESGDKDYRLDAKLTIKEFTKIIIKTIRYHNNSHILREYDKVNMKLKKAASAIEKVLSEDEEIGTNKFQH